MVTQTRPQTVNPPKPALLPASAPPLPRVELPAFEAHVVHGVGVRWVVGTDRQAVEDLAARIASEEHISVGRRTACVVTDGVCSYVKLLGEAPLLATIVPN